MPSAAFSIDYSPHGCIWKDFSSLENVFMNLPSRHKKGSREKEQCDEDLLRAFGLFYKFHTLPGRISLYVKYASDQQLPHTSVKPVANTKINVSLIRGIS